MKNFFITTMFLFVMHALHATKGIVYHNGVDFPFLEHVCEDQRLVLRCSHIVIVNPFKYDMELVNCRGWEKIGDVADRYHAQLAIAGGLCKLDDGEPQELFKMDGRYVHNGHINHLGAVAWNRGELSKMQIDKIDHSSGIVSPCFEQKNVDFWENAQNILGADTVLLKNGEIVVRPQENSLIPSSFFDGNYGKTAIGITEEGVLIFVALNIFLGDEKEEGCDGRLSSLEVAKVMENLGCIDALSLSGKPSMFYQGKTFSSLSEEDVGNVLVLKCRDECFEEDEDSDEEYNEEEDEYCFFGV